LAMKWMSYLEKQAALGLQFIREPKSLTAMITQGLCEKKCKT